jgi:hypothetical protein
MWPTFALALFGFSRFVESASRTLGDVLVTQVMYPAKPVLAVLTGGYLIWAFREVWSTLRRRREMIQPPQEAA